MINNLSKFAQEKLTIGAIRKIGEIENMLTEKETSFLASQIEEHALTDKVAGFHIENFYTMIIFSSVMNQYEKL